MFLFKVSYEFWAQTSLTLIKVCYLFVVIQYSVHVFDPDGINRAIKQDPFSVGCRAGGIFSESIGQDTWKNYQSILEYLLSSIKKDQMIFVIFTYMALPSQIMVDVFLHQGKTHIFFSGMLCNVQLELFARAIYSRKKEGMKQTSLPSDHSCEVGSNWP